MAGLTARDAHGHLDGDARVATSDAAPANGPLSFAGRIGVLGVNARLLAATIALGVAAALAGALFPTGLAPVDGVPGSVRLPTGSVVVGGVSALVASAFVLSALVLRCHDRGHSGWWLLLTFVPLVGALFMLYLLVWPGGDEVNRFGPRRAATALDKLGGVLGLALAVLSLVGAAFALHGLAGGELEQTLRELGAAGGSGGDAGPLEVRRAR